MSRELELGARERVKMLQTAKKILRLYCVPVQTTHCLDAVHGASRRECLFAIYE